MAQEFLHHDRERVGGIVGVFRVLRRDARIAELERPMVEAGA